MDTETFRSGQAAIKTGQTEDALKINGIGADNIAVDAGIETGAPEFGPGAFPAHRYGLARGWKMLENLANTAELRTGQCDLFVDAMNHIGGVAGWARPACRHESSDNEGLRAVTGGGQLSARQQGQELSEGIL